MPLTDKQKQRVDGILLHINDFLDKRFAQAKRINPKLATVEADARWHIVETLREILSELKWFGQNKILVADVLSSSDEAKKRDLFNPEGQVSIQNEVVPVDDQGNKDKRTGQLEVNDVKSLYKALDPAFEKIIMLIQSWIWWDLRDCADLYRFEAQVQRLESLRASELETTVQELYRREMQMKADEAVTKENVLRFELYRLKEIIDRFEQRRREDRGFQMIVFCRELDASAESDAICLRLAKRLMLIDRLRLQPAALDDNARQFYAPHLAIPADQVTAAAIIEFEQRQARIDRQSLADQLSAGRALGEAVSYKALKCEDMQYRCNQMIAEYGLQPLAPAAPQAAQQQSAAVGE